MDTISDYTLYCTEEQTIKALELGVPICQHPFNASIIKANRSMFSNLVYINDIFYLIPTAEEMIGFLEETLKEVSVRQSIIGSWFYELYINPYELIEKNCGYISRREATLAAIDAALEYLSKRKEE